MHSIKLKKVKWQNLLSYGTNINEVSLDNDGITWIKGPNGVGKSTIIEAITVALFGESYRKVPNKELINAANKGKLWVRLEFERTDTLGTKLYAVERELGRSGSMKMTLEIDGDGASRAAGVSQKMFEDDILGFNRNLFENVISLNTVQSKPFIDMSSDEKRKLLESIIALHMDKMKKINATENTIISSKFSDATNDAQKFASRIRELETARNTLLREQQDDIDQLQSDIDREAGEIAKIESDLVKLKAAEKKIVAKGTTLKADSDAFGDLDSLQNAVVEYKSLVGVAADDSPELTRLNGDIGIIDGKIKSTKSIIESLKETFVVPERFRSHGDLAGLKRQQKTLASSITSFETKISGKVSEMDHVKQEADALTAGIPCSTCGKLSTEDDVDGIRKTLRGKWTSLNKLKKELDGNLVSADATMADLTETIDRLDNISGQITTKENDLKSLNQSRTSTNTLVESIISNTKRRTDRITELKGILGDADIQIIEKEIITKKSQKQAIDDELATLRGTLTTNRDTQKAAAKARDAHGINLTNLNLRMTKRKNSGDGSSLALNSEQIEKARLDLEVAHDNIRKYSDEIELIKFIDEMYGDDGIKKFVLGIFVPTLNQVISHNIGLFSLPFAIEFDDSLDYEFVGKFGMAQVYKGLSQGQQRKLNFCISMAFRDFVSLIADFRINIMFLDEVLDISTDAEGLRDMIHLIKQKNEVDIDSIYLMSHRGEDFEEEWKHVIEVSNDGMYSKVNQLY